jgi:hypothetical protein
MQAPIAFLKIPRTRILRCRLRLVSEGREQAETHESHCHVAMSKRIVSGSGIAVDNRRQTYYVADAASSSVHVLARRADGGLREVSKFQTIHSLDNIEMNNNGQLAGGSSPLAYTSRAACKDGLGHSGMVGGRRVGCGASPGGLLLISLVGVLPRGYKGENQTEILMHDGSQVQACCPSPVIDYSTVVLSFNLVAFAAPFCQLSDVSSAIQVNAHTAVMSSPTGSGVLVCSIEKPVVLGDGIDIEREEL